MEYLVKIIQPRFCEKGREALGNKVDKNTLLFQRARGKNDKKDKTKEDYEYEKYQNDCTFKPNLLNS